MVDSKTLKASDITVFCADESLVITGSGSNYVVEYIGDTPNNITSNFKGKIANGTIFTITWQWGSGTSPANIPFSAVAISDGYTLASGESITIDFNKIEAKDLADETFGTTTVEYNGSTPTISATDIDTDLNASYFTVGTISNFTNAGEYEVTLTGKGVYTGSTTKVTVNVAKATITGKTTTTMIDSDSTEANAKTKLPKSMVVTNSNDDTFTINNIDWSSATSTSSTSGDITSYTFTTTLNETNYTGKVSAIVDVYADNGAVVDAVESELKSSITNSTVNGATVTTATSEDSKTVTLELAINDDSPSSSESETIELAFDVSNSDDAIKVLDFIKNADFKLAVQEQNEDDSTEVESSLIAFSFTEGFTVPEMTLKFDVSGSTTKNYFLGKFDNTGKFIGEYDDANLSQTNSAYVSRNVNGLISNIAVTSGNISAKITPNSGLSVGLYSTVYSSAYTPSGSSSSSSSSGSSTYSSANHYSTGSISSISSLAYIPEFRNVLLGELINLDRINVNDMEILGWYYDAEFTQPVTDTSMFIVSQAVLDNGLYPKFASTVSDTLIDGSTNAGFVDSSSNTNTNVLHTTVPSTIAKMLAKLF